MAIDPNRRNEKPYRPVDEDSGGGTPKNALLGMNNIILIVIGVALSLILVYFLMFNSVSSKMDKITKDVETANKNNLTSVDAKINNTLADMNTKISQVKTDTDSIIHDAIKSVPSAVDVNKALADAAEAKSSIANTNSDLQKTQQGIATLQEAVSKLATKSDLQGVRDSIPSLNTVTNNITQLQSSVETLTAEVNKLKSPTPTPTTTSGGNLTAQIVPNIFGSSTLNYTQILQAGSANSCTMQMVNGTGKAVDSIQLIVAFQVMNSTNTAVQALPSGVTATLTMNGYFGIWTQQTGGDPSQLVFTNGTSASSIFSSLYNLTQSTGVQNYSLILTLKGTADITGVSYNLMPIVKVVSYK